MSSIYSTSQMVCEFHFVVLFCTPPVLHTWQYRGEGGCPGKSGHVHCVNYVQEVDTWRVVSKFSKMILAFIVWLLEVIEQVKDEVPSKI